MPKRSYLLRGGLALLLVDGLALLLRAGVEHRLADLLVHRRALLLVHCVADLRNKSVIFKLIQRSVQRDKWLQ